VRVRVRVHVGEREVNDLRVGAVAEVSSAGVPGRVYQARIEAVGIKADPQTGNFPVKVADRAVIEKEDAEEPPR
jgi:multidrug efflux pump subunit AcrA (membrane-fusion protein)